MTEYDTKNKGICTECKAQMYMDKFEIITPPEYPNEQWSVCPECHSPEQDVRACDVIDCWAVAGVGVPTPGGYRWTCFEHKPDEAL